MKSGISMLSVFLIFLLMTPLWAGDSRDNPVTVPYCDGSTLEIYPYSYVTPGGGTPFIIYKSLVTAVPGGYRYAFEDLNDNDYNDIVIELRVKGEQTDSPRLEVEYISKDAGYLHWIHVVIDGSSQLVFKAEAASPGDVFTIQLPANQCPRFSIGKSFSASTALPEEEVDITLDITNDSNFAAQNVTVTDELSPYLEYISDDSGLSPAKQGNQYSWTIAELGVGETKTIHATVKVAAGAPAGTIDNQAFLSHQTLPQPIPSNIATLTVEEKPVEKSARFTITKSFSVPMAVAGDIVDITLEIKNSSNFIAQNISIYDELSPYLQYIGDNSNLVHTANGNRHTWTIPKLRINERKTFTIHVNVTNDAPAGTIVNRAFLSHRSLRQDIPSNEAVLDIQNVEVQLIKSVDKTSAKPGDELTYTLTVKNLSARSLENLNIMDRLSNQLEFVRQEGPLTFSQNNGALEWKGGLASKSEKVLKFTARVRGYVAKGNTIANTAELNAAPLPEAITSNTVTTTITADPISKSSIRFTKRAEVPQSDIGRVVRFRLTVQNRSGSPLINPVLEDILPQGFQYVAGSSILNGKKIQDPQGRSTIRWQIPVINAGQTATLRFQLVIGADAKRGKNINRAVLTTVDTSGQTLRLEASAFINVSTSSFVFYSGVEGYVFLDRDEDEFLGGGDVPLAGIEVRLSTGEQANTNKNGRYAFENLNPGEYAIGINTATLPPKYIPGSRTPVLAVLSDGLTDQVDFAVKLEREAIPNNARLQGRVFFDKNRDKVFNSKDLLTETFKVNLDGKLTCAGKQGTFVFSHIEPGNHRLIVEYDGGTVEQEIDIKKGNNTIDIPLRFSGISIIIRGEK
jgi:uncharacterized repeat protein (TIGR01451 family)